MALKDWKKIGKPWNKWGDTIYKNKKDSRFIQVSYYGYTHDYIVYFNTFENTRHFKSKSQALKFAKSYMRTH